MRLKKWLEERGDGGKMPGNSQPMQCLPTFKVLMSCAADLETFVQWAVIKNDKGLCHRAEGGRLSLVV